MSIGYRPILLLAGIGAAITSGLPRFDAVAPALAQEQKARSDTVRPEIGKPIQAAIDLLKKKRGKEALARVGEADAVKDKTAYELYLVERVRGQAAAAAGQASTAARALEMAALSPAAPAEERLLLLAAAAGQYYSAKDYGKASEVARRYFRDGGADRTVRTIYVEALFLGNDLAHATEELLADIRAEERAGKIPSEQQLQLLANAHFKRGDTASYGDVLEKLVAHYPKRDYWLAVVHSVATRRSFSGRLALDLARLKLATGTMQSAAEYFEATQLSLEAGFPAEATKIVERGFASGLLGTGPDAERHKRLSDLATKDFAADRKTLGQEDTRAAASDGGIALFNAGFNYVLHGKPDKGLEMMEQGLRKGGLKRPDDARLHLGYAYHLVGQNQKAIQMFKTVRGADGTAALARLWVIHLGRAS